MGGGLIFKEALKMRLHDYKHHGRRKLKDPLNIKIRKTYKDPRIWGLCVCSSSIVVSEGVLRKTQKTDKQQGSCIAGKWRAGKAVRRKPVGGSMEA